MFPEAIDHHARSEGMLWSRQPVRKRQPPTGLVCPGPRRGRSEFTSEDQRRLRFHEGTGAQVIAAHVNILRRGHPAIPQRTRHWFGCTFGVKLLDGVGIFLFAVVGLELGNGGVDTLLVVGPFRVRARQRQQPRGPGDIVARAATAVPRAHPVMLIQRALEDGQQPKVIGLRHRIELVIVALGALEREAHHAAGEHLHLAINHLQSIGHKGRNVGK